MAWPDASDVISAAARELGLVSADIADPYASSDDNVLQLCVLLNRLGQDLLRDYQWSHLELEHTFSTADGDDDYDVPLGFWRIINGTAWNRTQTQPLLGPLSAQQWQQLQGSSTASLTSQAFRLQGLTMYLYPTPSAVETVAYEYVSRYWVVAAGASRVSPPDSETASVSEAILHFDRRVLIDGLRWYFTRGKGFDSSGPQDDFMRAVARAQGGDGAAPVLSLSGSSGVHLLDGCNVPETGFGA